MKRNCEFINLGEFEMTSPVMRVSDPCYERDVWCCGTVDHCKLGTWEAGVLKTDEGEWGTRCAVLAVRHKDTGPDFNVIRLGKVRKVACKCVEQSFEVGVDSGQAGFFDDAFYQNDTVFEELPAPGFARERSVTPNAGNANNARNVNTDGSLNNNNAYNGNNGVRPDLVENGTD